MTHPLPATAVPASTYAAGTAGVLIAYWTIVQAELQPLSAALLLIGFCGIPMWSLEYCRASGKRNPSKISLPARRRRDRAIGSALIATAAMLSILIQLNWGGTQVTSLLDIVAPAGVIAVIVLGLYLLQPKGDPEPDSIETVAQSFRKLRTDGSMDAHQLQACLAWLVKIVFLPLMLAWLYAWLSELNRETANATDLTRWFVTIMAALYAIDTLFGTIGYLSTSRLIDAQIRSTDATWLGWISALTCYPPLSLLILRQWLDYNDGFSWQDWLLHSPSMFTAWGLVIILLTTIYVWATVVFGPRFSNLTNRGIITAGPFRYTKHPAYVSKNLSWWLISVPFISTADFTEAALNCAALVCVNLIYWLRAKTEERHLMSDPSYRAYASWIAREGIVAKCKAFVRARTSA